MKISVALCVQISCCLLFFLITGAAIKAQQHEAYHAKIADEAAGSDGEIGLSKKQPLVIKIPRKLLKYENRSMVNGLPIYTANVVVVGERIKVGGESNWKAGGWPPMFTVFFEKSSKKNGYTEIECRSASGYAKLRLWGAATDIDAILHQLVFLGPVETFESSDEFKALTEKLLPITFPGALAKIPRSKQLQLLKELGYNDDGLGLEEFKGKQYITFAATDPTTEFNSLQVNQSARIATVLKALVLPAFNKVAPIITDSNEIYGIKIRARIFYRDFLSERNMNPHAEVLEIFAPYDLVEKFFNLDISNQKLIDGSVVLVDGNRIDVDLSKAAQI